MGLREGENQVLSWSAPLAPRAGPSRPMRSVATLLLALSALGVLLLLRACDLQTVPERACSTGFRWNVDYKQCLPLGPYCGEGLTWDGHRCAPSR